MLTNSEISFEDFQYNVIKIPQRHGQTDGQRDNLP